MRPGLFRNISYESLVLVAVQFASAGLLLITGPILPTDGFSWFVGLAGLAVGGWAFLSMGLKNIHVFPEVDHDCRLTTTGPYRYVRHPMYLALLLICLVLLLNETTWLRFVVWLMLLGDLHLKMVREERFLRERFTDYAAYQAQTARLIPCLY